MNTNYEKSYFDGGMLGYIGINLLTILLTTVTLGLAFPWVKCIKQNWMTKHTIINGQRLRFNGTGLSLFSDYIIWLLLTIVTFGIYGFWLTIKIKQWEVKNTEFSNASVSA